MNGNWCKKGIYPWKHQFYMMDFVNLSKSLVSQRSLFAGTTYILDIYHIASRP